MIDHKTLNIGDKVKLSNDKCIVDEILHDKEGNRYTLATSIKWRSEGKNSPFISYLFPICKYEIRRRY